VIRILGPRDFDEDVTKVVASLRGNFAGILALGAQIFSPAGDDAFALRIEYVASLMFIPLAINLFRSRQRLGWMQLCGAILVVSRGLALIFPPATVCTTQRRCCGGSDFPA
jgi:hypothetical protein